ncbi:hypothetical protein SAMN02799624_05342 [Paenibacillus sp. UNC496MF]|uniref:hypothetical protein n=1 Tax=Paenibacillus sp. UNC496MF TaxID=1502753 RepID=UPI0008E33B1A|nr:hypothetical protein [Paenibacillus sp. UNC496MF]SFJ64450.1 hypothetical protein SAMN02799624_05342 [Paenibacillus sp. UNC496MF]
MAYVSLNNFKKQRTDHRSHRRRELHIAERGRYEFRESPMHGFIYEVYDHERMTNYRQDQPVHNQGDLFDGFLPFKCDYCKAVVFDIQPVRYRAVYTMLVRPKLPTAEWRDSDVNVTYACCAACKYGPLPIPEKMIGHHLTKLYQDGRLVLEQPRKH